MKILILGSSGLIGNTIYSFLSSFREYTIYGSQRNNQTNNNIIKFDAQNIGELESFLCDTKIDFIINCIGITKHRKAIKNVPETILVNSILPWKLLEFSKIFKFKLIQVSTDCVFSGTDGDYSEKSLPNAFDIYGKSKALGEICNDKNCITIRTSTIGHEIENKYGLLEWFLSQKKCYGYSKAFFSGLPTIILAQIIKKYLISNKKLYGLYHIGSKKISKYNLLNKINKIYNAKIDLIFDDTIVINRSLNSDKFKLATGYKPFDWDYMINFMKEHNSSK